MKKLLLALTLVFPSMLFAGESGISQFAIDQNWTGFYVGGSLGQLWSQFDGHVVDTSFFDRDGQFFPSLEQRYRPHKIAFVGGGQLGYLFQAGRFIFGTELSLHGINLKDTHTLVDGELSDLSNNIFKVGDSFSSQVSWQASWVGHLGFQLKKWKLYGLGGVTVTKPKVSTNIVSVLIDEDLFPASHGQDSKSLVGGTVGLGAEYPLWCNFSLGLEYRYTDFGSKKHYDVGSDAVSALPNGFIYTNLIAKQKLLTHLVLLRLNYQFKRL